MSPAIRRAASGAAAALAFGAATATSWAAVLPPHRTLRVLVVSDEVNPHGLTDAELTQPGDLSAALRDPSAGLALDPAADGVLEIATNDIATATALLAREACDPAAYDVLVYFAHRIPDDGPDGPARQDAFVAAASAFLEAGGGVVSFHHGAYLTAGKDQVLQLVGGRATGAVPWDTVTGQDVIAVATGHFVTTNGLAYDGTMGFGDAARGVPFADYPFFRNVPDERYPTFDVDPAAGDVEILFASFYDGAPRLLGFTHRRPGWRGTVLAYQPGEYQPHACDPANPNFQVLANAIVFVADATAVEDPDLRLRKDAAPGAVRLEWTGGRGPQCVFRGADPAAVTGWLATSDTGSALDDAPPAGLACYVVRSR